MFVPLDYDPPMAFWPSPGLSFRLREGFESLGRLLQPPMRRLLIMFVCNAPPERQVKNVKEKLQKWLAIAHCRKKSWQP